MLHSFLGPINTFFRNAAAWTGHTTQQVQQAEAVGRSPVPVPSGWAEELENGAPTSQEQEEEDPDYLEPDAEEVCLALGSYRLC